MEPMKEAFKKALDKTEIMPLGISLINNIEAKMISKPEEIKESLVLQLTQKVRWEESMRKLVSLGVDTFIEVGAGKVLAGLMRKIDRKLSIVSVFDSDSLEKACSIF